ncbi:MAG: SDR family NAD(P)-dependent oxidoreductase, partial [Planctomycetota bacterium]
MTRPPYVAVVTGSSSGIGAAIAIRFAETIATHVVVHGRENIQGANQTASAVRERGAAAETIMGDLADVDSDHRLLSLPWQINGRVDAWVHCAGADVLTDASDISFDEKLLHLLEVDVF